MLALTRLLPREDLAEWLADLEHIRIVGMTRLLAPPVEARPDHNLKVPEVADRLGVSPEYVYRHWKKKFFPFARPEGGKLLFSAAGLDAYLRESSRKG